MRGISTSLACYKRSLGGSEPLRNVRAGVYKTTRRGDVWITYEEAQPPPKIGVTKAWKSWNSSVYYLLDNQGFSDIFLFCSV